MKNPGLAAVLSVLIPGVGQIYNGDFLRGIFWLIVTPGMWIGTGGLLGVPCDCRDDRIQPGVSEQSNGAPLTPSLRVPLSAPGLGNDQRHRLSWGGHHA